MPEARGLTRRAGVYALGALLCGALALELQLRCSIHLAPDASRHRYARPPLVRLRVSISRDIPGLRARSTLFTTNALGVRGDELDLTQAGPLRVLALGDSTTECLLLADRDAWPRRLQDELAAGLGRQVWVGNAAGSGELTLDYIVHVKELVPQFRPALVLVTPGGYELQAAVEDKLLPMDLSSAEKLQAYAQRLYGAQDQQAERTLGELGYSYLSYELRARIAPEQLDMTAFYVKMRARRAAHPKLPRLEDIDDALDIYRANLRALVEAARALSPKAQLVLMTRPFLWKPQPNPAEAATLWGGYSCMDCDSPEYYSQAALALGLRRFNQALLEVCAEASLACLDLDLQIPKDLTHFYDDAHMREAGARLTARVIARFLLERRLLH